MRSSMDARIGYINAVQKFRELGASEEDLKQITISQGYLQLEASLNATNTTYNFGVVVNQPTPGSQTSVSATEVRLNLQDAFFVNEMALFLSIRNDVAGTINDYRNYLLSFPTAWFFGNGTSSAGEQHRMMVLWNSYIRLAVNNDILIPQWDTRKHLFVPERQYPNYVGSPNNVFYNEYDEVNGSEDGFYPVEPNVILWGSANNSLSLNLPWPIGFTDADFDFRAVIMMRGVLAQNCTSVAAGKTFKSTAPAQIIIPG